MNLTDIQTIKSILKENNLWAKKSLGQNFLLSQEVLNKIIASAELSGDDIVVEIGPGLGTLTQELAQKAKLVLAIEKDYRLCQYLRKKFKAQSSKIKIIHDDILTYNLITLTPYNYKVVANLPYNITSPVIRKFLEADNKPSEMVLMVQKEVAERICAEPGNSERGILTVMVEFYTDKREIIQIVDKSCFWPVPKVDSAILKLKVKSEKIKVEEKIFFRIVKAGFSAKRRQIHNSLAATLRLTKEEIFAILKNSKIDPTVRAEDLTLEQWIALYQNFIKKR